MSDINALPGLQNVFWWKPKPKFKIFKRPHNLGDAISPFIVYHVLRELAPEALQRTASNTLFAIGSILNHAADGDVVWGSGINGIKSAADYRFDTLDVRSVRGPHTRDFMLARGIACPAVFGDPGVLISRYVTPARIEKNFELFIPHFSQGKVTAEGCETLYTVGTDFQGFMDKLCRSRIVYSASLHGIVFAEAYGIPAVLTMLSRTENLLKYEDYYRGTGRESFPVAYSVEEARTMTPAPLPDVAPIQQRLLEAFPIDLWARG